MANSTSFKFYSDAALTQEVAAPFQILQNVSGNTPEAERVFQFWLGSTIASRKLQRASNPGVDQIILGIVDDAPSDGQPASALKIFQGANPPADWSQIAGGNQIVLGTDLLSGVANAISIFVRWDDALGVISPTDTTVRPKIMANCIDVPQ